MDRRDTPAEPQIAEAGALEWLRDVPALNVIGFSLTGFGDATSFGKLLEADLRQHGWAGVVREISYGGLSINALAALTPMAAAPVQVGDIVALELATSFFSQHKYSLDAARPLVFAIAEYFVSRGAQRVFFLDLFRADLDDNDCVVQAIREASRYFDLPVLDLKAMFRSLSIDKPVGTTDGVHPDAAARRMIADAIFGLLASGPWPVARPKPYAGPLYAYVDLVPRIHGLPRHAYEGRGKSICAVVAPAGFHVELELDQSEHVVGFCFLYGPDTGFVEVTVGDHPVQELITFDENSYYRRIGFRPLDAHGNRVAVRVLSKVRDMALVRASGIATQGRRDYLCGLIVKRPRSLTSEWSLESI